MGLGRLVGDTRARAPNARQRASWTPWVWRWGWLRTARYQPGKAEPNARARAMSPGCRGTSNSEGGRTFYRRSSLPPVLATPALWGSATFTGVGEPTTMASGGAVSLSFSAVPGRHPGPGRRRFFPESAPEPWPGRGSLWPAGPLRSHCPLFGQAGEGTRSQEGAVGLT